MVADTCICLACWPGGSFSNCSARDDCAIEFLLICSKPICLLITNTNISEKIEISSQGAHQLALRRKSAKVLPGAMKVSTMRAPSERGGDEGSTAATGLGGTGAAAIQHLRRADCSSANGKCTTDR